MHGSETQRTNVELVVAEGIESVEKEDLGHRADQLSKGEESLDRGRIFLALLGVSSIDTLANPMKQPEVFRWE